MNRSDFQRLSELRLKEAKALLAAGFPEGAYYLSGYAVECALKACIARRTQEFDFPEKKRVNDSHTHDLGKLLVLAGLSEDLQLEFAADAAMEWRWGIVRDWSEESRYDMLQGGEPERFQRATLMINVIGAQSGGVMQWIKQRW
ncbi:MAG: HEPN domain-containing protein [Terracidiphilus sp.]